MTTLAKHDDQQAPRSPTMTQPRTLKLGTLSLSPSSSVTSSASDLKLMLLMDPYGLMDAQPTKLLTSNATLPTETDADSLTYGLPSVLGSSSMYEEEEYFDPYNTNIYGSSIKRQVSSNSLSSASRLMEAKQQASFYLEQTTANDTKEEEALLFQEADEKATRLETAKRDVSFYLQEQFHDALESSSDEEDEPNASLEHFQDEDHFQDTVSDLLLVNTAPSSPQEAPLEDNFQDCNQVEQDATPIKSHSPTNVDFYLHELQDNEQIVDLKQEAEIDFYLQQENLQRDLIDLEEEPTPSPVIEKIACTTHRLDMDGAIRHKTVFYGDSMVPASKTLSFEDESGWSSASSTPTFQESKTEVMLPLHAPTPPLPASPTATPEQEPITSILDEDTKVTRVSLDKYISAKVANMVFQNPQQMTQKRRQITIQRIDMAGILQPTQVFGPFLDGNFEDEPSEVHEAKVDQPAYSVATTLKQDLEDQKMRAIMAQQQEQVGCGCGWSVFGWFKRR